MGAIFTQILVANGMEHGGRLKVQGWEDRKTEILNGKSCHRLQAVTREGRQNIEAGRWERVEERRNVNRETETVAGFDAMRFAEEFPLRNATCGLRHFL
jgi:hypothetical protein